MCDTSLSETLGVGYGRPRGGRFGGSTTGSRTYRSRYENWEEWSGRMDQPSVVLQEPVMKVAVKSKTARRDMVDNDTLFTKPRQFQII